VILTIDYGFTREQFAADSCDTLQVRAHHRKLASLFEQVGHADISAHVNWTDLAEAAQGAGAALAGFTDQHHFLTAILTRLLAAAHDLSPTEKRAVQTLLHPEMLGRSFQVLALAKNFPGSLTGFDFARRPLLVSEPAT